MATDYDYLTSLPASHITQAASHNFYKTNQVFTSLKFVPVFIYFHFTCKAQRQNCFPSSVSHSKYLQQPGWGQGKARIRKSLEVSHMTLRTQVLEPSCAVSKCTLSEILITSEDTGSHHHGIFRSKLLPAVSFLVGFCSCSLCSISSGARLPIDGLKGMHQLHTNFHKHFSLIP